jgi:hypothetical protein
MIFKIQTCDHPHRTFKIINVNFTHLEKRIAKLEAELKDYGTPFKLKRLRHRINRDIAGLEERIVKVERSQPEEISKKPAPNPAHERNRKRALKSIRHNYRRLRFATGPVAAYGLECKLRLIHELRLVSSQEFLKLSRRASALLFYADERELAP